MGNLITDELSEAVQGFAPKTIVAVSAGVAWDASGYLAFCVPTDCTYTIDGAGSSGSLREGDIRVIREGQTYTFDSSMNIEVA